MEQVATSVLSGYTDTYFNYYEKEDVQRKYHEKEIVSTIYFYTNLEYLSLNQQVEAKVSAKQIQKQTQH
jgi:hypothetical protein